ncbi:MAG: ABC transporter permease [Oscillospiraceae bacterium]|nr:ABC transporter permease [Oscillospiraceae bacterium]
MIDSRNDFASKARAFLTNNVVTIVFVIFVVAGYFSSPGISVSGLLDEVLSRFFRNGLLVLALIIPVMAGLGLNFGIVVGALAAVLAIIPVRYFGIGGMGGLMLCFLIALPIALLFGWLTGKLYNKTRGQEMIAGIIVGFFAEGLFLIFVLFVIGGIIPVAAGHPMIIPRTLDGEAVPGVGIRAAFDMGAHPTHPVAMRNPDHVPGLSNSMDFLWQMDFTLALFIMAIGVVAFLVIRRIMAGKNKAIKKSSKLVFGLKCGFWGFVALLALHGFLMPNGMIFWFPAIGSGFQLPVSPFAGMRMIPVVTGLVILAFCLFTMYFTKTKLGQDCRSVGQNQQIANASGINVDRTRIIATMISTVLGAWGMIIFLQNMGTVSTYTAHRQIGMFSVAALLVGGATAAKAGVKNAVLGLLLFHAMFVVSPGVGRLIFGNELVAEATRNFMTYGVIGLSLGLHVWKTRKAAERELRLD